MTSENELKLLDKPWTLSAEDIEEKMRVSSHTGLSKREVKKRRKKFGVNELKEHERRSTVEIFLEQFASPIVLLLLAAAIISFIVGELVESIAIAIALLINVLIGFFTELKAVRSMEALQTMGQVEAKVLRDTDIQRISANKIVVGDIVHVDSGDIITADVRLFEASKLQVKEATLTGESVPVSKNTDVLAEDTSLAERSNMLYKGTAVTRGSGKGIVVTTGMDTEIGSISSLVEEAESEVSPLEKRLEHLGKQLIVITLIVGTLVVLAGIIEGKDLILMIETGIALAVASIPEGLPIVATISLARGMYIMAQHQVLINKLSAVETLGSTTVILTDKTGTLTENRMTAVKYELASGTIEVTGRGYKLNGEFQQEGSKINVDDNYELKRALEIGTLCNNASLNAKETHESLEPDDVIGEPTEVALLIAGRKSDIKRDKLLDTLPEKKEVAFDPEVKMMGTFHKKGENQYLVAVKGAPTQVIKNSTQILTQNNPVEFPKEKQNTWIDKSDQMAQEGLRVLALAMKEGSSIDVDPYSELIFIGIVGILDPPREETRDSIKKCQTAGIDVIMLTGDKAVTAANIAHSVGLVDDENSPVMHGSEIKDLDTIELEEKERIVKHSIFARVDPEQKLNLVSLQQEKGEIVAMTGDGVNDAPALKKADIGIAMGIRGTQVAKEASDVILKNDAFSSIVTAVRQGRTIFDNIRNFVIYLLSCNLAEILVIGVGALLGLPLPLLPMQILFLNLITDVFPALALGLGEGESAIMQRTPRDPEEPILTRFHWTKIGSYGLILTASVLLSFVISLSLYGVDSPMPVSISFLTLAFAQLWHVFNMRAPESGFVVNEITTNRYVWLALFFSAIILLAGLYIPLLATILKLTVPDLRGYGIIVVLSLTPLVIGQITKPVEKRFIT